MARLKNRWRFVLDAENGDRNIPTQCALVFDIKDQYPDLKRPHVDSRFIAFTDRATDQRLEWKTPPRAAAWINDWDAGRSPEPQAVVLHRSDAKIKRATSQSGVPRHRQPGDNHKSKRIRLR